MTTTKASADRGQRLEQLQQQLTERIARLVTREDWQRMLETAARFHRYSLNNLMLIAIQKPDATRVAGYQTWKSLGRRVRGGEKGIAILAPCRYKVRDKEEGTERWVVRGFTVATVFDISQTDGEELPADVRPVLLEGSAPVGLWDQLAKQVAAAGFMLSRGDCRGANGRTDYASRTVTVRADVDDAQAVKTLVHELGHILCDHESQMMFGCRGRLEVEAESVAYVVANAVGMSTDSYSLPYVASWTAGSIDQVKSTADKVVRVSAAILEGLEAVQ
jgi:antirestriction protein ArdC